MLFVFIGGFVFSVIYFGNEYYNNKNDLQSNNRTVKGVVVKSKTFIKRGTRELVVTFRYEVNGKIYENTKSSDTSLNSGDSCMVKYFVDNPQNSELQE
jgi:hypothetical protein